MSVLFLNDSIQSEHPISDFQLNIVKQVAEQFIQEHGYRSVFNGQLLFQNAPDSMEHELKAMLENPQLGMRQVIPVIGFWIEDFALEFTSPLFDFEQQRLQFAQIQINELEALIKTEKQIEVQLTIQDILLELEHDEIFEALPILEEQVSDATEPPCTFPSNEHGAVKRLECLLQHAQHSVSLTITHDLLEQHQTIQTLELSEEKELELKAQTWLDNLTNSEKNNLNQFIQSYKAQPLAMQKAIDRISS